MHLYKKLISLFFLSLCLGFPLMSKVNDEQEALLENLPPDQRSAIMGKMEKSNDLNEDIEKAFSKEGSLIQRPNKEEIEEIEPCDDCVYGYDLFRFSPSTFAPANIIPVSSTYSLGPGDGLEINLYGSEQESKKGLISREGTFELPILGTVSLSGLTFSEAKELLKDRVSNELMGTSVSVSLTELRAITVYVLGEAHQPGSYTLSALSTITNALFVSGGVNKKGSLRNIQIKRGNKIVETYDLYDLLINGDTTSDLRLEDGDTVFIPFIQDRVTLGGSFKRPFVYEIKKGDTLNDVISFAGGFKSEVSSQPRIEYSTIDRVNNKREITSFLLDEKNRNNTIQNGDVVNVSEIAGLKPLSIEMVGEFKNPGVHSIIAGDTILDVINKAGGYTSSAYSQGAVFLRKSVAEQEKQAFMRSADNLEELMIQITSLENGAEVTEFSLAPFYSLVTRLRTIEPVGRMVSSFDLLELKTNPYANFEVRDGDKIIIPKRSNSVSIVGEVLNATSIKFYPDYDINDYLNSAGGLNFQADKDRIYVIAPNGESKIYKRKFLRNGTDIMPGSTVVVSRDAQPWDAIKLTRIITPILADLATSAAAIAAISD